ncbi:hypothetical protein LUZ60_012645 [Juncus effusus]|nr:hypothetical protein LUZ60_012645 [Juncus effusus]
MESQRDMESQQGTAQPLLKSSESNNHNANNGGYEAGSTKTRDQSKASLVEKAVSQGARGAALLAKHLPTGSALVFEVFSPITTARGECKLSSRIETVTLISFCGISSAILTFTDSFKYSQNKLRYGIATCHGLLTLDGTSPLSDPSKYKIKGSDFIHLITTLVIFAAVVLYNEYVVDCFFGQISEEEWLVQAFTAAPVLIGIFGCVLFVMYPSKRHGLGFPLGGLSSLEE